MRAQHLLAFSLLAACAGQTPAPSSVVPDTARQYYEQEVDPILRAKCAGCHTVGQQVVAIDFYDRANSYDTIVASPVVGKYDSSAPLLAVMAVEHPSLTYTQDELDKIDEWFALEREERGL